MKIILLKDLRGLGRKDDIRNVSDGYARNFLIPQGVAKPATSRELEKINTQKESLAKTDIQIGEMLGELHRETESAPISVPIKMGKKGEIFSSVKEVDIRKALLTAKPQLGVLKFEIELEKHIKEVGIHEAGINAGRGIKNTFKIEVKAKE